MNVQTISLQKNLFQCSLLALLEWAESKLYEDEGGAFTDKQEGIRLSTDLIKVNSLNFSTNFVVICLSFDFLANFIR